MESCRTEVTIAVPDFIRDYRDAERVQGYCAECSSYGRVWGCPPFDFDFDEMIAGCNQARVFATKITFSEDMLSKTYSVEERKAVMAQAIHEAWEVELPRLYALEAATPGSVIFTGRCRLCRPKECTRVNGLPCRHPDKMRHSLESVGFDLERTSRELLGIPLQWAIDGHLPAYITLITAIFMP